MKYVKKSIGWKFVNIVVVFHTNYSPFLKKVLHFVKECDNMCLTKE
jgi:hypothetical protein